MASAVSRAGAKKLVPPDGGWGWVVAGAYALNNVFVLPLISGMGLVFQVTFNDLDITATQGSLIITLNHGLGMLLSFFGGPVLSRLGYRRVALGGAACVVAGVMSISVASGFWSLVFAYSILTSIGVAAVMASFTLAINSFFKEKRSKAIGLGMSITGLGPILMPHLMNQLMFSYGWRQASMILAALCLHSVVAALLLRPAKWYMKEAPQAVDEELVPLRDAPGEQCVNSSDVSVAKPPNGTPTMPKNSSENVEEDKDIETPKRLDLSMRSLDSSDYLETIASVSHPDVRKSKPDTALNPTSRYKWWESQEINLGSSVNIFSEPDTETKKENVINIKPTEEYERSCIKRWLRNIAKFFDLGLLKDPIFVNILLGLSIAACAEINFSLLMPFILEDMDFDTSEIAALMSVIGFSDMFFRVVSPFIGDWCKAKPRVMYLTSLGMIVFTRTIMLFTTTYTLMLVVAVAIGVTKGIRTVYMNIVIPSYVPIERLPFASGIQMFVNGVILIIFGPLLGVVKDISGSYKFPIIILNIVTMLTIAMWLSEFLYLRCRTNRVVENGSVT